MHKITRLISAMGLAFAPVLLTAPAQAALAHTWVSATGSDGDTCDITAPCATFSGAYGKTAAGGEITCVNSGNYGPVAITTSITINCEHAIGSTTHSGGLSEGNISIDTPAGAVVILRGLDIDGLGFSGGSLIIFTGAGVLHVHKVKINNKSGSADGIFFGPTGAAQLFVSDSYIHDNGSSGTTGGIYVKPASGIEANVSINRTQIENNYFGIIADGTGGGIIRGTVSDSVISDNTNNGITVSTTGSNVVLLIDQTQVVGNNFGLVATGSNAGMLVRNTSVVSNATGLDTGSGGVLYSYGINSVNGNTTTDGTFTGTVGLK